MNEKTFFNHHYFKAFKEGQRVYKWVEMYDYIKGARVNARQEGVIIKKKSFSLTVQWNYYQESISAKQAIDGLSLIYEPNDLIKELL